MTQLLSADDNRKQIEIDNELPVLIKLGCGAVSGATAQTGGQERNYEYLYFSLANYY